MKIAVYTIALNEEHNVKKWAESAKDADYLYILDTGSQPSAFLLYDKYKINYNRAFISPWRYDDARNTALSLLPSYIDICVSLDMDEYLIDGWREELERVWTENTTRVRYNYAFSINKDGSPKLVYDADKIHTRFNYRWKRAVHETVYYTGDKKEVISTSNLWIHQNQSEQPHRKDYLNLLKMSFDSDYRDPQIMFWYGRELLFRGFYQNAQNILEQFVKREDAWDVEKSQAWLYLYDIKKDTECLKKALEECSRKETIYAYSLIAEKETAIHLLKYAKTSKFTSYLSDPDIDKKIDDLLSKLGENQ